jgi:hypothetical protein
MSSWSQRRQFTYLGILGTIALVAVIFIGFHFFYKAPTCTDDIQNADEAGVDCGGSCVKICATAFLTPRVAWTRLERVDAGLYNVATYIVNPNTTVGAPRVPYHVVLYDDKGIEIVEYTGTVTIPPHRNTLAFTGAVAVDKRIPVKALFEFTRPPEWQLRADPLTLVSVGKKQYAEDVTSGASLSVTLKNTGIDPIGSTDVYAVLYDKDKNALGFSRTVIDAIGSYGSVIAPFTWPHPFGSTVISIEVLPVSE